MLRRIVIKYFCFVSLLFVLCSRTVYAHDAENQISERVARYYAELIPEHGNIFIVNQDGTGDFFSIQEGVNQVSDGDVLFIYPGSYEENVEIKGKTVHLIGLDKEQCIILSNAKNYFHVPLTFGAGVVANLTIHGYDAGYNEDIYYELQKVEDAKIRRANEFPGYAIHIDTDYSTGKTLSLLGCKIISETNSCVGIGTRPGNHIVIDGCEFIGENLAGGLFYHNSSNAGESVLTVKNSIFRMAIPQNSFAMQSISDINHVTLHFEAVKVCDANRQEFLSGDIRIEKSEQSEFVTGEETESEQSVVEENSWHGLPAFRLDSVSKNNSIKCLNG